MNLIALGKLFYINFLNHEKFILSGDIIESKSFSFEILNKTIFDFIYVFSEKYFLKGAYNALRVSMYTFIGYFLSTKIMMLLPFTWTLQTLFDFIKFEFSFFLSFHTDCSKLLKHWVEFI